MNSNSVSSEKKSSRFGLRPLPEGTTFKKTKMLVGTWFGSGRIKPAAGTMGSLAAIPFGVAIQATVGMVGLMIATALLLWMGTIAADYYGRKSGKKDDQAIVVDEVVGMWIAGFAAGTDWGLWAVAFILFRFFDITKPFPASYFDKSEKGGALYVMLDDVVAGIYAFLGVASASIITLF